MSKTAVVSSKIPLQVWDKIEIIVERNGRPGIYLSRIEEIQSDSIIATAPNLVGGTDLMRAQDIVYVQFKKPDAMYRFGARLAVRPGNVVYLTNFGNLERVQRREHVRIKKRLNIKYTLLKRNNQFYGEPLWFDSATADISAGGILMSINGDDIIKDDIILIRMDEYREIGVPRLLSVMCCRLMRTEQGAFAGVQFLTADTLARLFSPEELQKLPSHILRFDAQLQNKMVNYIFEEQIRERQRRCAND